MDTWKAMLGNQVLVSAVVGWTVAQVLKTLIDFALNHAAHKFWLVHYHGIKEDQDLPQVILATRAANRAH